MKSFKLSLLLFLLFSPFTHAQDVEEYLDFFSNLVGKWESKYEVNDGIVNTEQWDIQWILNKHFIQIDEKGVPDKYPDFTYEEKYLFTLDENYKLVGWLFVDNTEQYFSTIKGELEGNKMKLKGKGKNFTYNETIEFKDGKLIRTSDGTYKGQPVSKVVAVYVKK
jgi:hypothetical protein